MLKMWMKFLKLNFDRKNLRKYYNYMLIKIDRIIFFFKLFYRKQMSSFLGSRIFFACENGDLDRVQELLS